MAETKPKANNSLRTPKPKKLGLAVPPALRMPHDELITAAPAPPAPTEAVESTMPSQTSLTRHTQTAGETPPVAPVRDYTKVANSITREAIPAGVFKGKSKQLYDALYQLTRGAVVPVRSVRISRPRLMKKAGIGARITFDANVAHLQAAGLVTVRQIAGEHDGNEYTIYLPEEVAESRPSMTSQTSMTRYAQKLDRLVRLETSQTRHTSIAEESTVYEGSKTSFKTNTEKTDDDEALADFVAVVRRAAREVTGRELSVAERQRWAELADVLVTELKIAAGRTTISSVPAFLAEHLRRRLWKKEKRQIEAEAADPATTNSAPKADAAQCPDCFGTGMWYPQGYEKGVARCRHEKLTPEAGKSDEDQTPE